MGISLSHDLAVLLAASSHGNKDAAASSGSSPKIARELEQEYHPPCQFRSGKKCMAFVPRCDQCSHMDESAKKPSLWEVLLGLDPIN
ncbi:MAG: hypothetical protein KGI45_02040 [Patescibacteria group bacterium]|nr:hypothetical protein [Patescibacteria group bacterium]MDE1940990.1 hypothetical protein [Patescibacteria group bacterium]MDE1966834.1 hypothetical protein [Patescibacteria group bacterium]